MGGLLWPPPSDPGAVVAKAYLDTLRHHWRLLAIPIVVCFALGVVFAVLTPRTYQVGAALWADSSGPADYAPGQSPPSSVQSILLAQLLTTRTFMRSVVLASPLAEEYQKLDEVQADQFLWRVAGMLTLNTPGPQLLTLTVEGEDPDQAKGLASAVLSEFEKARSQQALTYAQDQLAIAQARLATTQAERAAAENQATIAANEEAQQAVDAQQLALAAAEAGANSLRVVDEPDVAHPTSRRTGMLLTAFAGLLAGATISLLALMYLQFRSTSPRPINDKPELNDKPEPEPRVPQEAAERAGQRDPLMPSL